MGRGGGLQKQKTPLWILSFVLMVMFQQGRIVPSMLGRVRLDTLMQHCPRRNQLLWNSPVRFWKWWHWEIYFREKLTKTQVLKIYLLEFLPAFIIFLGFVILSRLLGWQVWTQRIPIKQIKNTFHLHFSFWASFLLKTIQRISSE